VQVGWTWDVEFAGYIAALEWGYYERAGLSVALAEGGPTVSPENALLDDAADIAVTVPDSTVAAIAGGADLAIVGVQYRRDPLSLVSDRGSGIAVPSDLSGRTICVPEVSRPAFDGFMSENGLAAGDVTVSTHTDCVEAVAAGNADAAVGFATSLPEDLRAAGGDPAVFHLDEFSRPRVQNTIVARRSAGADGWLHEEFLRASGRGWEANFADVSAVPLSCRATWFADLARSMDAETRHNDAQRAYMGEGEEALLLDASGAAALYGLANRYGLALRDVLGPAAARRVA